MPQPRPKITDDDLTRLRSGLRCEAISLAPAPANASAGHAGRWRINTGAVMAQYIYHLDNNEPVLVVLDLATATLHRDKLQANYMHCSWEVVGNWSNIALTDQGIDADLVLYTPTDDDHDTTRERLAAAAYVYDLQRRDHPWEVSIESDHGDTITYERVLAGQPVTVNGTTYDADHYTRPLYVARHATIKGAAIVDYGADAATSQIAARARAAHHQDPQLPPQEITMDPKERLAALTARHPATRHGLIAMAIVAGKTDDDIDAEITEEDRKDALAAKDAEIEALKATVAEKDEEITALKAQADEDDDEDDDDEAVKAAALAARALKAGATKPPAGGNAGDGDPAPKTFFAAQRLICAENPKLRGTAIRAAIFRRWPDLRPEHLR